METRVDSLYVSLQNIIGITIRVQIDASLELNQSGFLSPATSMNSSSVLPIRSPSLAGAPLIMQSASQMANRGSSLQQQQQQQNAAVAAVAAANAQHNALM